MSDADRQDGLDGYDRDHAPSDSSDIDPTSDNPPGPEDAHGPPVAQPFPKETVIDFYRVIDTLGQGTFGYVYLARDQNLDRHVALKVPRADRIDLAKSLKSLEQEARTLARLADDPAFRNIVRVHAVAHDEKLGLPFVLVTQFIKGSNLKKYLEDNRLDPPVAATLIAKVARALHYAHSKRIVHLDIKPGNILIGPNQEPYLADFGLARREVDLRHARGVSGTWQYMSPEQARGELPVLDDHDICLSDIYSLGVVLFEVLTGRRPFQGPNEREDTIDEKKNAPGDPRIEERLHWICQKALHKRKDKRYQRAEDLAEALEAFAEGSHVAPHVARSLRDRDPAPEPPAPATEIASRRDAATWIANCKGLLSFDADDDWFFLNLLPGLRDPASGLPESILFWKNRILETDANDPFTFGLLYGQSGCGKSSFVKAGLLPVLKQSAPHLDVVRLDATANGTESRLLELLRTKYSGLSADLDLRDALFALPGRDLVPAHGKLLIVLDQFEQWLQANPEPDGTGLVRALRGCIGARVKCLVMVRTEFLAGATRFMHAFGLEQKEGSNMAVIDLFDLEHAKQVLTAFGRGCGRIPLDGPPTPEQEKFLDAAIRDLAEKEYEDTDPTEEGRVKCVRLAMFAFMMKDRTHWEPSSMPPGGATRVGVNFLRSRFDIEGAPHLDYARAAENVLDSLLPAKEKKIRDTTEKRSGYDLRNVARLSHADFARLLDILDQERLITPVHVAADVAASHVAASLRDDSLTPG